MPGDWAAALSTYHGLPTIPTLSTLGHARFQDAVQSSQLLPLVFSTHHGHRTRSAPSCAAGRRPFDWHNDTSSWRCMPFACSSSSETSSPVAETSESGPDASLQDTGLLELSPNTTTAPVITRASARVVQRRAIRAAQLSLAVRNTGDEAAVTTAVLNALSAQEEVVNKTMDALRSKYPRKLLTLHETSSADIVRENLREIMLLSGGSLSVKDFLAIVQRNPSLLQAPFVTVSGRKLTILGTYGIPPSTFLHLLSRICLLSLPDDNLVDMLNFLRHDIGVVRIDRVLRSFPLVLSLSIPNLEEKVRQLKLAGLSPVASIVETSPFVLSGRASEIQRKVQAISTILGERDGDPIYYLRRFPQLLLAQHETIMQSYAGMVSYFGKKQAQLLLQRQPLLLGQNWDGMLTTLVKLDEVFGREGATRIVLQAPTVMAFSWATLEGKIMFVQGVMGRSLDEVISWPALLTRSVERRLKPRYEVLHAQGKADAYSLGSIFGCTDADFSKRHGLHGL